VRYTAEADAHNIDRFADSFSVITTVEGTTATSDRNRMKPHGRPTIDPASGCPNAS
jgi:hypothetical protein